MLNKVQWLRLALRDMRAIAEYLAQKDTEISHEIVDTIWKSGMSLQALSARGRPGRQQGTRELILAQYPYFLVYRVRGNIVQILRILHSSQQWPPVAS